MAAESTPQPEITLYRGWEDSGAYIWSPFVTKVELRLRLTGLSYCTKSGSVLKAPRGKIPYLAMSGMGVDSISSSILSDSALIIEKMVENGLLEDINAKLSPTEKAHDLALRALLEDKLYFYHVCMHFHHISDGLFPNHAKSNALYSNLRRTSCGARTTMSCGRTCSQRYLTQHR